jgi:hypothetical protein
MTSPRPPVQDDLTALRASLAGSVAYIEADLTAYALPFTTQGPSFRVRSRSLAGFAEVDAAAQNGPRYTYSPVVEEGDTTATAEVSTPGACMGLTALLARVVCLAPTWLLSPARPA